MRFSTAGAPRNAEEWGVTEISCEWDGDRCVRAGEHTAEYDDAGLLRIRRDDRVVWERAVDGDEPDPLAADEALEVWLDAVAGAARRALGERDAAAIKVSPGFRHDSRPGATVVERNYVADAAARRRPRGDRPLLGTADRPAAADRRGRPASLALAARA